MVLLFIFLFFLFSSEAYKAAKRLEKQEKKEKRKDANQRSEKKRKSSERMEDEEKKAEHDSVKITSLQPIRRKPMDTVDSVSTLLFSAVDVGVRNVIAVRRNYNSLVEVSKCRY